MTGLIADTSDHRLIRQSTAAIAARYGHAYYAERARDGGHIAERSRTRTLRSSDSEPVSSGRRLGR